jgi:hypothetical protein
MLETLISKSQLIKYAAFLLAILTANIARAEHVSQSDCETLKNGYFQLEVYRMRTWQHEAEVRNILEKLGTKLECSQTQFENAIRQHMDWLANQRNKDAKSNPSLVEPVDAVLRRLCHY